MLEIERKLKKRGFKKVAGLDEAGRGALAGPVVAAALMVLNPAVFKDDFSEIRDSKKLSPKKRESLYKKIINCSGIIWEVAEVSEKTIDRVNILNATKIAMTKAVKKMIKKGFQLDYLLIDGNFKINSGIKELPVIRGDETIFSCMAAGIVAKVSRDRIMKKHITKYPQYGFSSNKGYGTKYHKKAIAKHGTSLIHRKSFKVSI